MKELQGKAKEYLKSFQKEGKRKTKDKIRRKVKKNKM